MKILLTRSIAVVLVLFSSSAFSSGGFWTIGSPNPHPTSSSASGEIGGLLYIVGGGGANTRTLEIYNPIANTWTSGANLSIAAIGAAAGGINGKLYVAEGFTDDAFTNALRIYDPQSNSWTEGAAAPSLRFIVAGASIGDKLYITGGRRFGEGPFSALEIYNATTGSWSIGTPVPIATHGGLGANLGGKFCVVGGSTNPNTDTDVTGALQIYDPATNLWSMGPVMPMPVSRMAGGVVGGKLVVVGGNAASGEFNSDVQIYDPVSNTWAFGPPAPLARYNAVGGTVGGALYVTGGQDNTGSNFGELDIFFGSSFRAQVQPPLDSDGNSVFTVKRGVVPIKFALSEDGSATCTFPTATIAVTRTAGATTGSVNESIYAMSADSGSNFRITGCLYDYNLSSAALGVGTYRVDININNEVVGSAAFQLK